MPRITPERRERQRDRIVAAMLASIQERGIVETSMTDVIERSGLSAGAIYGYFSGKDEILLEVASRIMHGRSEILLDLAGSDAVPRPDEALAILIGTLPDGALRGGAILQIWGHAATHADLRAIAAEVMARLVGTIETYLGAWFRQQGAGEREAEEAARRATPAFMALAQGCIVQASLLEGRDVATVTAGLRDLIEGPG